MQWYWTWGGECFGYRNGQDLFTYRGRHAGRFHGDEVYGANGRYLGEVKNENRLITNQAKTGWTKSSFGRLQGGSYARYVNYVGYVMYLGYEDFPAPDQFE
jgi:hypothetical protein